MQVKRGVLKHCYYTSKEVLRFLFNARREACSTGSRCKDVFPPATCATRFAARIEKESQLSSRTYKTLRKDMQWPKNIICHQSYWHVQILTRWNLKIYNLLYINKVYTSGYNLTKGNFAQNCIWARKLRLRSHNERRITIAYIIIDSLKLFICNK